MRRTNWAGNVTYATDAVGAGGAADAASGAFSGTTLFASACTRRTASGVVLAIAPPMAAIHAPQRTIRYCAERIGR